MTARPRPPSSRPAGKLSSDVDGSGRPHGHALPKAPP